jgi:DNA (cytosine-5)-methyltransferase 1
MKYKPKVIDLFAGAGGFGLGFKLAEYSICCSLEIDHWATDTLRKNKTTNAIIIEDDIRNYRTEKQIRKACKNCIPDVIIGGPPCQGFSVAGPAYKDPKVTCLSFYDQAK